MYLEDKCKWGARCQRSHPPRWEWIKFLPRSEEVCQEYIEGRCFLGENCRRRHPPQPTPAEGKRSSSARLATTKETSTSVKTKNNGATVVQQVEIPAPTDRVSKPNAPVATASCTPTGQQSKGKGRMMENTPIKAVRSVPTEVFRTMKQDTAKSSEQADSTSLPSVQKDNPPNLDRSGMENDEIRVGGICWDFQHGRCRRAQCKYRHEQPGGVSQSGEEGTQRLISMLKWSVNELSKMLPSQTRNDLMQDGRAFPPTQRTVPDVPPGLSKIKENTPTRMTEGSSPDAPSTMSLRVQDSVTVTFGPGFAIQEVVTGFESRVLILKNIPSHVTSSMIKKTLDPFGDVVNIHLPENRPAEGGKTVKATFTNHRNAAAAASALDGCTLFKAHITAILASQQSTSLGKGTVRDGDVLLEFPAPHRDAYVGYSTLQGAEHATRTAYRAQMGDSILSASIYSGLPIVGRYNVKFRGLPPDTETVEMEAFGPNNAVMFTRPNYMSLDDALKELQARLEIYGELISVKVISPPFENQTVRAWAHFTTPTAADEACRDFNFRRPRYFGHGTVKVQHVMSITYQLPNRIFDVLSDTLRYLRSCVYTTAHRCDIIFQSRLRAQTGSVGVKLSAEALPTLTRLKSSFEGILRGEVVRFEGRAAWDSFFARSSGAEFIATLEASHPMVIIQIDLVKSCIRLFGSPHRTWRARTAIQEQMIKLRSRKVHSLPLDRNLLGIFMNSDLLKLQQELGTENVYIDSRTWSLKVRGNNDAVQVATLIIQRARRQCGRKHPGENSCPICLDKVSLPVTLDCGHTWCKNCLTSYLLAAIDTKSFPLNCLGSGARCSSQIPLKIAHRLLSSEDFQRVIHASFLAYIHSRPSEFHYCPTPDCQQVYRTAPPDTVLQCPSCLVRICGNCHIEHHEGKRCPDPEKEELRLFEEWSVGRDVKRCPGCKTFIEREAGCNHMTCTRCRTHICWVCLETFSESEACYDHMRKTHGGIGL
ncbi:hypothetical protein BDY19DRAFT_107788 [Irpex rosettiformis]|uniref:Uncharacterized protein n=1 Tax=Irpex rosettiformis TaxID=378272 RepID=A0ACB8U578_9APHY|nr:hypothetical protein BDY19DRAFT_107788 [Irpex rosettiformis]